MLSVGACSAGYPIRTEPRLLRVAATCRSVTMWRRGSSVAPRTVPAPRQSAYSRSPAARGRRRLRRRRDVFCFECHEELLHNPVLLPDDISRFAELVRVRGQSEDAKPRDRARIAQRVILLHEIIARGLEVVHEQGCAKKPARRKRALRGTPKDTTYISGRCQGTAWQDGRVHGERRAISAER